MGFHSHDPDAIEFSFVLVGRRMPHGRIFPAMRVPCEYSKEREAAPLGSAPFRGYPMAITSNRLHRDNFRSAKKTLVPDVRRKKDATPSPLRQRLAARGWS
jgi:hypothetical protein